MEIHGDRDMEGVRDECAKQLLLSCYSDTIGVFGDSEVVPRVGPEYQVEIPPLVEDCCRAQLVPGSSEFAENTGSSLLELPIPRMWSKVEVENINGIVEFEKSEESQIISNNDHSRPRVQTANPLSIPRLHKDVLSDYQLVCGIKSTLNNYVNKIDQVEEDLCPLQDFLCASWEDVEHDSFLLGLYIFGKNLSVVKRFVGSKKMEDILSFYYGQFYRSKRYRRWADCRKSRSRSHMSGSKIFSGWRQQELLSRLFSLVSVECQEKIAEAAREYGEGKTTLEEYVFTLKSAVGVRMLVQAVGIGKGKQDLTGTSMEKNKSSNPNSMHSEIPIGKACSFLTSAEVIKFLTGGFRLSKARSNDLFWEAVWPRLLAGGWHSEQPKDTIYSSKSSLVFLVPGVKKFSRRKLVKGNHYFDSVSDVLNKVASEPGLLKLENGGVNGNIEKDEFGSDLDLKGEKYHSSDMQRQFYLQPPHLNSDSHLQKFMIIDTSVVHGAGRPKVRELRSLPIRNFGVSASSSVSSGSYEDTSDESLGKQELNNHNCANVEELDMGPCLHSTDWMNNHSDESTPNALDSSAGVKDNRRSKSTCLSIKKQPRKAMKYQPIRKAKPGSLDYMVPCTKPQSFASGYDANSTCIVEDVSAECKLCEDDSPCTSTSPFTCEDMVIEPTLDLSPISCLVGESADRKGTVTENCPVTKECPENVRSPKSLDLNVPDVSSDSGGNRAIIDDTSQKNGIPCIDPLLCVSETSQKPEPLKLPDAIPSAELQTSTNSRRQSTRNRPLTMKALEALESGFFDSAKKRKSVDIPEGKLKKKSIRRIRGDVGVEDFPNSGSKKDSNDSGIGAYPNGLHNCSDVVGQSQV